jgi:hypothetical protein
VVSIGNAPVIQALSAARATLARETGRDLDDYFVVQVPAMYALFLAFEDDVGVLHVKTVFHPDRSGVVHDPPVPAQSTWNALHQLSVGFKTCSE